MFASGSNSHNFKADYWDSYSNPTAFLEVFWFISLPMRQCSKHFFPPISFLCSFKAAWVFCHSVGMFLFFRTTKTHTLLEVLVPLESYSCFLTSFLLHISKRFFLSEWSSSGAARWDVIVTMLAVKFLWNALVVFYWLMFSASLVLYVLVPVLLVGVSEKSACQLL